MVGEKKRTWTGIIKYIVLILLTAIMIYPFIWMLSSSLKLNNEVFNFPIQWIPETVHWENYEDIWSKIPLLTFIGNTFKLSIIVTILQVLTSTFAAYAFAKLEFKGRKVLFMAYITTIAVPWQSYMLPQFILMSKIGLNDNHLAIILLQAFTAFGVFLMKQFFQDIPTELCEAARIDGLSEYGIWAKIMIPNAKPAISTLVIFSFVATWNDFLGPQIYLTTTAKKTIQIGLRMFITQYSTDYALMMAASVVSLIPILVLFLWLQKYFVQGVVSSGIKG